jgi:hypothetical protein
MQPFIVFSLPRSRSAWMAHWLSDHDLIVGHDIGIECRGVRDFADRFTSGLDGSCETGSMFAWRLIRKEIPGIKFVVIRRKRGAVARSLERFGIVMPEAEFDARERALDEIEVQPEAIRLEFDDLSLPNSAAMLLNHVAPDKTFNKGQWQDFDAVNIQVKMEERLGRLVQNEAHIEAMKAEARVGLDALDQGYAVAIEPFQHFWPEAKALAEAHSVEVDGGVEPRRPFQVDELGMAELQNAGILRVFSLRLNKKIVGYFTWQVCLDLESRGLLVAHQGAWYVAPGHAQGTLQLWDQSVATLKAMGVKHIFPHHRTQGRGNDLGKFFRRRGAKEIQRTYSLWIGD